MLIICMCVQIYHDYERCLCMGSFGGFYLENRKYIYSYLGQQYLVLRFAKSLEQNLKSRPLKKIQALSLVLS